MDKFGLIILGLISSVLASESIVAQSAYADGSSRSDGSSVAPKTFAAFETPTRRRCAIDLAGKNHVAVRVFGSDKVYYYPVKEQLTERDQTMVVERGLERDLLKAPMSRAYAVPRYGVGYGYEGEGLLVFAGLLIEGCPVPPIVTGLFMPINRIQPYVSRHFLNTYFALE